MWRFILAAAGAFIMTWLFDSIGEADKRNGETKEDKHEGK